MKFFRSTIIAFLITLGLITVVAFNWMAGVVEAQVSPLLNFIGKVTNIDGTEVADGNYDFTFSLYTTAAEGSSVWSETLSSSTRFSGTITNVSSGPTGTTYTYGGAFSTSTLRLGQYLSNGSATGAPALIIDYDTSANTVTVASNSPTWSIGQLINNRPFVEGGVINIHLGSVTDISNIDFNQTLFLEVVFNGETMQPRKILTTVPSAFEAARLGGKSGDELAALAEDETVIGEWTFNNIVSLATTSSVTALTVTQNGTGSIVEFKGGASTYLAVLNDGRVQVGNYIFPTTYGSPGNVLKTDAGGNMYWDVDYGGLGGAGLWATTSDELVMRQVNTSLAVVIGNIATSTFSGNIFEVQGSSLFDRINISNQEQLRLYDADSSNYIGLRATTTMSGDFVLTLPDGVGTPGQALVTDGSGNMYWGTPTGGTIYVNAGTAGQMPYYESSGSTLSGTSTVFVNPVGYFAVGTSTPSQLLTIGGTSGSQFLVNSIGQVVSGTWQGDIIGNQYGGIGTSSDWWFGIAFVESGSWSPTSTLSAVYGGTGLSSYSVGDILFAGNADILDRLGIGGNGQILSVVAGLPAWASTSTLGMKIEDITGILAVTQGGTGQNFASTTGFIYLDDGTAIASATIAISYTDLAAGTGLLLNGNSMSINPAGDWTGTLDGHEGNEFFLLTTWYATTTDALNQGSINKYYSTLLFAADLAATSTDALAQGANNKYYSTLLFAADLYSTTTDAITQGSTNLYWTDNRFDIRLAATTSLSNLITLTGLSTIGTITAGTWRADPIEVPYGGTGTSTFQANSLVYATADNVIGEILPGPNGYALVMQGNTPTWASTSPGTAHDILSVLHSDTEDTGTLQRGDLLVVNSNTLWDRMALGSSGYILYSNGIDTIWSTTTAITALGIIAQGTWQAETIEILYGGTGATTATGARANLDLTDAFTFGINSTGTAGYVWLSDGDGRGYWVATSSLGLGSGNTSKFIGTTTETTDGSVASSSYQGYAAANYICNAEYAGSQFCRTYDIIVTIAEDDISYWGNDVSDAWIAEGPPGFTADSNDCTGWTSNLNTRLGAFWMLNSNGGGAGWLVNCQQVKPLACCSK